MCQPTNIDHAEKRLAEHWYLQVDLTIMTISWKNNRKSASNANNLSKTISLTLIKMLNTVLAML